MPPPATANTTSKNFGLKYGYEFSDSARLTVTGVHTDAALDYPNVSLHGRQRS